MTTAKQAKSELAKRELSRRKLNWFIKYMMPEYRTNWHHKLIIDKLEAVERGEIRKLMIFVPPRHGKSEIASINLPAWFFGRNPKKSIIAASYNSDLAVSFGRKARNIVNSEEYKKIFPGVTLAEDSKAAGQWNTNQGGEYTAVGIGGGTTGRGADIFLIDDPVKDLQEAESITIQERNIGWYRSVARTRLSPKGAIVVIQTRWDFNDLAGQLLEAEGDWEVISLPAIAEHDEKERKSGEALWADQFDLEELQAIKKDLGTELWSSLYQQSPLSLDSQVFKKSMFRHRPMDDVLALATRVFVTVDPAPGKNQKSDFIGICVNYVDNENFWNLKAFKIKFDPSKLIDLFFKMYEEIKYECLGIEKGMYLDVIRPFFEEEMRKRDVFISVRELSHGQRSKELRIRGLIPRYEAKQIYHIIGECSALEDELLRFPKSPHDDVSDATAYQSQIAEAPFGAQQKVEVARNRQERKNIKKDDSGL